MTKINTVAENATEKIQYAQCVHYKGTSYTLSRVLPKFAGEERYTFKGKDAGFKKYLATLLPGSKQYALRTGNIGYIYDRYSGKFEVCNVAEIEAGRNASKVNIPEAKKPEHLPKYIFVNPIEFDSFEEVIALIKADFPELEDWNRKSDYDYSSYTDIRGIKEAKGLFKKLETVGLKAYRENIRNGNK